MCGIIGCIAGEDRKEQFSNIFDLYENQKLRGSNGAGVCVSNPSTGKVRRVRTYDPHWLFSAYYKDLWGSIREGDLVMFHHRIPTSTPEGESYNHPLANENKDIFMVHNGILYNYEQVGKELMKKGHKFESYDGKTFTDSEVLIHLLEDADTTSIKEMVQHLTTGIHGSFAIAFFHKYSNKMYLYAHENPIIISKDLDNNYYFSSEFDERNLQGLTQVKELDDDELGVLSSKGYTKIKIIKNKQKDWGKMGDACRYNWCEGSGYCASCNLLPDCQWYQANKYRQKQKMLICNKTKITKRTRKYIHHIISDLLECGVALNNQEDGGVFIDFDEFYDEMGSQIKTNKNTKHLLLSDYETNATLQKIMLGRLNNQGYLVYDDENNIIYEYEDIKYEGGEEQ